MKKVSVIVPIYNTEIYLHKCIDSIINQTYQNLEIILVNDGSKDSSGDICREYQYKDSRIKYIEQENKGEGAARNTGLKCCTGDYIVFCDSDDLLKLNGVELLVSHIDEAELVVGGIEKIEHGRLVKYIPSERLAEGSKAIAECILYQNYYMNPAICKLYKAEIIRKEKIFFANYKYGADTDYVYKYLHYTNKIFFINEPVYSVNIVEGSMSTGIVNNSWVYMRAQYELSKDLTRDFDEFRHGILMRCIKTTLLLECRISKKSFLKVSRDIAVYLIREEPIRKCYHEGMYNHVILFLLKGHNYKILYRVINFRVKWGIKL